MEPKIKKHLLDYQRDTYTNQDMLNLEQGVEYLDCSLGTNPYGCSTTLLNHKVPLEINQMVSYPARSRAFIQGLIDFWQDKVNLYEDNIQLEVGTFGVIERLNKLFVDDKCRVLGYCPQFSDYMQDVICCGGTFEYVSLKPQANFRFDGEEVIKALSTEHNLLYIDNPNNPTGQVIPIAVIERIVGEAEKKGISVLIDEAYGDYMERGDSAVTLVPKYNNLFVARSFTKGFGLAGLRVGYVVMSQNLLKAYSKVAHPFPVNSLGQYFAELALQDLDFLEDCKKRIRKTKSNLMKTVSKLRVLETDPNIPIFAIQHPNPEIDLFKEFLDHYVITTSGEHFVGLGKNFVRLRIPLGKDQELEDVIRKLEELAEK